ncbi:hypothetical protein M409DRAFT_25400 [Zasmidium cellare ATCC 36951]|uniref:Heterokaryon incompatibility domain-containing protein n=1 Tax=Zasmidium cellare ATCC 36951 TaxID=1080233 RepID=A0A6A6CAH3_ZASCE|nr:uncharacterized protein M409DRAFT_25400 [Zasmidium cellare ATCC 36951]KAF2164051.1 hypothetical protein M409DRAFT_25400 [Zasmidium cellare ATCC 36951]
MSKRKRSCSLAFTHEPLAHPSKDIRLLRFKSKHDLGELRMMDCEVTTWPFEKAPPYAAASYVWGSPEHTSWVTLNDRHYEVRRNCYDALSQIRRQAPDSYVWRDSICINQDDLDEKALQVAMMGDIYQRANMVYSCVGEHSDGSGDVIEVVREVASYVRSISPNPGSNLGSLARQKICEITSCPGRDTGGEVMHDYSLYHRCLDPSFKSAFTVIGNRPYWNRVWIVQEVRLAEHCLILCGENHISVDDFGTFMKVMYENESGDVARDVDGPNSRIN